MTTVPMINAPKTGAAPNESDETSMLRQMKPHVPGIVIFADHGRPLPYTVRYHSVVVFADVSGFTALCEKYSTMGQSGVDQLTRTLNEYLSALVESILGSDGDILKFAGDAILAIWRVGRVEELQGEMNKVLQCCLDIQHTCGHWDTDIGVKLTVKLGVSAGEMSVTFLGNQEYRHYVELGPAVTAVNVAENFCQSGMIVLSPAALEYYQPRMFETELMEDKQHIRIVSVLPRQRSWSLPISTLPDVYTVTDKSNSRRLSAVSDDVALDDYGNIVPREPGKKRPESVLKTPLDQPSDRPATPEVTAIQAPDINIEETDTARSATPDSAKPKGFKALGKSKLGAKFGKLRKVVETVTEMKLDIALRLYILPPVLKKFDDNQPLEYLSEMRQVSIVFMNLVLEQQDAEELLQKIFEIVYSKSKAMHGCLNKVFLFDKGCTFLVIFGLPGYKHENDCAHALICSGRMKSQLDKIDGVQRVSIGITTGTTFCGVVGHPKRHEYSVIGRKVNMAARLMMHYPDKITCDTDTFQNCRLSPAYFVVLITKRMKGLRNVGVIREFAGMTKDEKMVAKSITRSAYPMLGRSAEEFVFREQVKAITSIEKNRRHLIFSGPSGIGKTKLLDQLVTIANQKSFKVVSCRMELEDSSYPYFVANHILRALLGNQGYSNQIEKEPYLLDALGEEDVNYIYLLNDVLGTDLSKPLAVAGTVINEKMTRRRILCKIAKACVVGETETVIIIDDAHNIDTSSWEFLLELIAIKAVLVVLGLRPNIIDAPPCREALLFMESPDVKLFDMGTLDMKFMAPLACQMMDVVSIPSDLDRILRERSHGVPAWVREILKDMLDQHQLLVVIDDGRRAFQESRVVPKRVLIKPLSSMEALDGGGIETSMSSAALNVIVTEYQNTTEDDANDSEKAMLSAFGIQSEPSNPVYRDTRDTKQMASGGAMVMDKFLNIPQENRSKSPGKSSHQMERIAIFAKGINARDIPVPMSMKELIIGRIDSMRASDQLMVKCAAVLGKKIRRDILEMLLPKAHRIKLVRTIRRLMESGIFQCGNTPPYKLVSRISREDGGQQKYRCFCHKEDVIPKSGGLEACFEPMFTNNLLQQTAYATLMETQRIELHTKAAHYFELSADELRADIPYYVLSRPPAENLQEKLQRLQYEDMFVHKKAKHVRGNKVSDETYAREAAQIKARRGRRHGVAVTAEDAIPLVHRVLEEAKPLQQLGCLVESLLPLYDNICHHWQRANQPWNVLCTMIEAAAAALYVKRNSKALEFILRVREMLVEFPTPAPEREIEYRALKAKLERLHGKVNFESGDFEEAYRCMSRAQRILGMEQFGENMKSRMFLVKMISRFWWNWRCTYIQYRPASLLTLEQGYCLMDLYNMDKDAGNTRAKFIHALQHFNTVIGQRVHLHQALQAYAAVIECSRERKWFDTVNRLEAELLNGCAARSDEMSTEDRCLLAKVYAERCIHMFLDGQTETAYIAGRTAADICLGVHDMETTKLLTPYFFYLCLVKGDYLESLTLLKQLKFAAQISDDRKYRAMYYTLCIEIATAGGFPPDSVGNGVLFMTKYLQSCDASAMDFMPRYLAAMVTAVWCARKGKWAQTQNWFDYWETYETSDTSFFAMIGRAKKLECMLLSLAECLEIGNKRVADKLKQNIEKDLKKLRTSTDTIPVLRQRRLHLECYYSALCESTVEGRYLYKRAKASFRKHENKFEEAWLINNANVWSTTDRIKHINEKWQLQADYHQLDWELCGKSGLLRNQYTLPIPSKIKVKIN